MVAFQAGYHKTLERHEAAQTFLHHQTPTSRHSPLDAPFCSSKLVIIHPHHLCHSSWFFPLTSFRRGSKLSINCITTSSAVCLRAACSSVSVELSSVTLPFFSFPASLPRRFAEFRSPAASRSHRSSPRGIATRRFSTSHSVSVSCNNICDIRAQGVGDNLRRSNAS